MKTKLNVRSDIIALKFGENSYLDTIRSFNPHWDYKHYNGKTSQKVKFLRTIDRSHLKCDVFNGSLVNSSRPILYTFVFHKPPG